MQKKALKVALFENVPHNNALATHLGLKFTQKLHQTSLFIFLLLI